MQSTMHTCFSGPIEYSNSSSPQYWITYTAQAIPVNNSDCYVTCWHEEYHKLAHIHNSLHPTYQLGVDQLMSLLSTVWQTEVQKWGERGLGQGRWQNDSQMLKMKACSYCTSLCWLLPPKVMLTAVYLSPSTADGQLNCFDNKAG